MVQPPVQNSATRDNLKQFSKVGYEDAKSWMERRLAGMKNGVPMAEASGLSREWASSVDTDILLGMDLGMADIEATNLAKTIREGARSTNWADGTNTAQRGLQNNEWAIKIKQCKLL